MRRDLQIWECWAVEILSRITINHSCVSRYRAQYWLFVSRSPNIWNEIMKPVQRVLSNMMYVTMIICTQFSNWTYRRLFLFENGHRHFLHENVCIFSLRFQRHTYSTAPHYIKAHMSNNCIIKRFAVTHVSFGGKKFKTFMLKWTSSQTEYAGGIPKKFRPTFSVWNVCA